MPTIRMPPIAPAGLPVGVKDSLRADFRTNEFVKMVERGYRLVWQRAARCPCVPVNKQTDQSNPNCPACKGVGWIYFAPTDYSVTAQGANAGIMTDSQKAVVDSLPGAVIIRGIMTGISAFANAVDKIGPWEEGMAMVTVRQENKLGFYDKLVNLDSDIAYNQVIKSGTGAALKTRYPVVGVNYLASVSKVFQQGLDFDVTAGGIVWLAGKAPAEKTVLTLHYLVHPTWIIVAHPRSVRVATIKRKQKVPDSPMGSAVPLPVQAMVKYDFLAFA